MSSASIDGAAAARIAAMRLRADAQAEREAGLQARFAALVRERDALRALLLAKKGGGGGVEAGKA